MNPLDLYQPFSPWWQAGNRSNRRRSQEWLFSSKRDAERIAKAERARQRRKAAQARKKINKGNQG